MDINIFICLEGKLFIISKSYPHQILYWQKDPINRDRIFNPIIQPKARQFHLPLSSFSTDDEYRDSHRHHHIGRGCIDD